MAMLPMSLTDDMRLRVLYDAAPFLETPLATHLETRALPPALRYFSAISVRLQCVSPSP